MAQFQRAEARRVVLLVEDNVDAQEVYSKTLRHAGFEVVQARSVEEAHAAAARVDPDVVVLDCRLPDGDGLELAREWRTHPKMADVPVLVLTAFSARQDVEAALLAGADAFMVKPVPGHVLAMQIEKLLSGQRASQKL